MKVLLVDDLTQQQQITGVLSVVKRMQLHADGRLTGSNDPGELEEGQQSPPGRMSIGGGSPSNLVILASQSYFFSTRNSW